VLRSLNVLAHNVGMRAPCISRYSAPRMACWLVLLMFCLVPYAVAGQADQPWISIDTRAQTLSVIAGGEVLRRFRQISLGHNGVAMERREGDGKTPLGAFRIAWINRNSRYRLFFGLDYPNQEQAEWAWRHKLIDSETYFRIREALFQGRVPPQDTPLGGYIGIHGIGSLDPRTHAIMNWTQGCVALTNAQIAELSQWAKVGTRVVIADGAVALKGAH
jgi:murein L,D-transpeptidase YafK